VSQRLVVVTGKGGVGKTTVTAALARAASNAGKRVLAVEVGPGPLATLLGAPTLTSEPARITPRLSAATIAPEEALVDFVEGVLRFRAFARRLLASTSFQVLAAAAPGLPELLVLNRLHGWLTARRLGRQVYDLVVVDAPASGHSLPLLAAPRALGALARLGPVGDLLARIEKLLADPAATLVCVVSTPEDLAVRETVELYRDVVRLGLPVAPPIMNALPPRRFAAGDADAIAGLEKSHAGHPHLVAARLHLERRRRAQAQLAALRRAVGTAAIPLPFLFAAPDGPAGIDALAAEIADAAGLAA
jgi:anion-transporting  ArsA/GET3 family ATPase